MGVSKKENRVELDRKPSELYGVNSLTIPI